MADMISANRHATNLTDEERIEQAQAAVKNGRAILRSLTGFARALTGRKDVEVVLHTGIPSTDNKKIYWRPPIELGHPAKHDRHLCDKRGENTQLLCEACRVREQIMAVILHEISHIAFDSFSPTTEAHKIAMTERAIEEWGTKYAERIKDSINKLPAWQKNDYKTMSGVISPFLPGLLNALEDARVNAAMFRARPGTKVMMRSHVAGILTDGIEQEDGSVMSWREQPLNAQVVAGCFVVAAGYEMDPSWFHSDVLKALEDSQLSKLCLEAGASRRAGDVYDISFKVLARLRELGYCLKPEEEPDDTPDAEDSDTEDEVADSEAQDPGAGDPGDDGEGDGELQEDGGHEEAPSPDEAASDPSGQEDSDPGEAGLGEGEDGEDQVSDDPAMDEAGEAGTEGADSAGDPPGEEASGEEEGADLGPDGPTSDEPAEAGAGSGADENESATGGDAGQAGEGDSLEEQSDDSEAEGGVDGSDPLDDDASSEASGEGDPGSQSTDWSGEPEESTDSDAGGSGLEDDPATEQPTGGSQDGDESSEEGVDGDSDQDEVPTDDGEIRSSDEGDGSNDSTGGAEASSDDNGTGEEAGPPELGEAGEETASSGGLDPFTDYSTENVDKQSEPSEPSGEGVPPSEDEEVDDASDVPFDMGEDKGEGGVQIIEDEPRPEMGDADDVEAALKLIENHEDPPKSIQVDKTNEAIDQAIIQGVYFETPSQTVWGVRVHREGQPGLNDRGKPVDNAWNHERILEAGLTLKEAGVECDLDVPESIMGKTLLHTRRVFENNQASRYQPNLRSGRVNRRVLGKRAWNDDDRLFGKKRIPGKRSYFVIIMVDCSGSTAGTNLVLIKRAAMAQAELCNRVGVPFAIYAHTFNNRQGKPFESSGGLVLDMYEIKAAEEPWDTQRKDRLADLGPDGGNLDGHALEFARKRADEVEATDKIILYYTDGRMPASNYSEELEILQREIRTCRAKGYHLLGVGIRTDSPIRHGLDTVRVDTDDDLKSVVTHLEKRLASDR